MAVHVPDERKTVPMQFFLNAEHSARDYLHYLQLDSPPEASASRGLRNLLENLSLLTGKMAACFRPPGQSPVLAPLVGNLDLILQKVSSSSLFARGDGPNYDEKGRLCTYIHCVTSWFHRLVRNINERLDEILEERYHSYRCTPLEVLESLKTDLTYLTSEVKEGFPPYFASDDYLSELRDTLDSLRNILEKQKLGPPFVGKDKQGSLQQWAEDFSRALKTRKKKLKTTRISGLLVERRAVGGQWKSFEELIEENKRLQVGLKEQQRNAREAEETNDSANVHQLKIRLQRTEQEKEQYQRESQLKGSQLAQSEQNVAQMREALAEAERRLEEEKEKVKTLSAPQQEEAAILGSVVPQKEPELPQQREEAASYQGKAAMWERHFRKLQKQSDRQAAELAKTLQTLAQVWKKLHEMSTPQQSMGDVVVAIDNRQEEFLKTMSDSAPTPSVRRATTSGEAEPDFLSSLPADVRELCQRIQHLIGEGVDTFGRALLGSQFSSADVISGTGVCFANSASFWRLIQRWSQAGVDVTEERLSAACQALSPDPRTVRPLSKPQMQKLRAASHLIFNTINFEAVTEVMRGSGHVSPSVLTYLAACDVSRRAQVQLLIDVIISLGEDGPDVLLSVLEESSHPHTAKGLRDILNRDEDRMPDLPALRRKVSNDDDDDHDDDLE